MLAFAAKLAGSLLLLGVAAFIGTAAIERDADHSFAENLTRYAQGTFASSSEPMSPTVAAIQVRTPREQEPKDDFSSVGPAIDAFLEGQPDAQLGVAIRWSNGETLYMRNSQEPYPMASVAKVYMLVAYLHRLEIEDRGPDADEIDLLQSMIETSNNDAAQEIWDALGGLNRMQSYLETIGMKPLMAPPLEEEEDDGDEVTEAWGDASQTASEMSLFLARLWHRELLNPDNTQLARSILGNVVEEQAWGVPTAVDALDPVAKVLVKNGWYPADDGTWRINSTGIVIPGQGEPYVVVIFGQGFDSWSDGIDTVDAVAAMINQIMLS